jgi:CRISPR system Cascade subunit CasB
MSVADSIISEVRARIARLDADTPDARAMLAKLRRGVGKEPGELPEVLEITVGGLPAAMGRDGGVSFAERAVYTALTFYALHRQGKNESMHAKSVMEDDKIKEDNSFGAALGRLIAPDASNLPALKRRFDAVVTAGDLAELARHARGLVQILHAKEPPVKFDYERFAKDLYEYCYPDRRNAVRLRWGRGFYRKFNAGWQNAPSEGE